MSGQTGISHRPRRQFAPDRVTALEACAIAAECAKKAGLLHVWTSQKSEACYYRAPDRHGVLRIATHTKRSQNDAMPDGPALVSVTFPEVNLKGFARDHVENQAANGIGLYLIRAPRKLESIMRREVTEADKPTRDRAAELAKTMRCNCDFDNWEPEAVTGHSHVCRIHKAVMAEPRR